MKLDAKSFVAVAGSLIAILASAPAFARSSRGDSGIKMKPTQVAPAQQAHAAVESESSDTGEDWKGSPEGNRFEVGALTGMGVIDSKAGWAVLATGAVNILEKGFIPDINDTAFIEVQAGPLFRFSGSTPFQYSTHLRWDFRRNRTWSFYALAGLGGHVAGDGLGGTRFLIFPRVGVGAMMDIGQVFNVRAELSHELIALGVSLPLF